MNSQQVQREQYDHYIAVDWAKSNMAIARMTGRSDKITAIDVEADIENFKIYLDQLKGKKILTIEETTTTQWLYTELADCVDRIIVCDPHRNRLLSEGPKTDKIDATKLVQLLRGGLLKEVYHSGSEFLYMRKLVSGYGDLIKAGVRLKNQRSALIRAVGKESKRKNVKLDRPLEQFVLDNLEEQIKTYEINKEKYENEFKRLGKRFKELRHQMDLPGIGWINAVKIVARVVSPYRFGKKGDYLSYCGLVKLEKKTGGKIFGRKSSRHSRELKSVYKTAALASIRGENEINDYYEYLIKEKRYPEYNARHAVARRIAILSWGVFKSGRAYKKVERQKLIN